MNPTASSGERGEAHCCEYKPLVVLPGKMSVYERFTSREKLFRLSGVYLAWDGYLKRRISVTNVRNEPSMSRIEPSLARTVQRTQSILLSFSRFVWHVKWNRAVDDSDSQAGCSCVKFTVPCKLSLRGNREPLRHYPRRPRGTFLIKNITVWSTTLSRVMKHFNIGVCKPKMNTKLSGRFR